MAGQECRHWEGKARSGTCNPARVWYYLHPFWCKESFEFIKPNIPSRANFKQNEKDLLLQAFCIFWWGKTQAEQTAKAIKDQGWALLICFYGGFSAHHSPVQSSFSLCAVSNRKNKQQTSLQSENPTICVGDWPCTGACKEGEWSKHSSFRAHS